MRESPLVLVCRHQAFIAAPVRSVWELVGEPSRHPEWWPEVVEVQGTRFGRGCSYCQVSHAEDGTTENRFVVDHIEELKELLVRCDESGLYMRWLLTEAQDGTFVDAEFGLDPDVAGQEGAKVDPERAKQELRGSLQSSLDGLADAAGLQPPSRSAAEDRASGGP